MFIPTTRHKCLVVLDAFLCKELVLTITTCFGMNVEPKVAWILKHVILTNSEAWVIVPSVEHECLVVLNVLLYKQLE